MDDSQEAKDSRTTRFWRRQDGRQKQRSRPGGGEGVEHRDILAYVASYEEASLFGCFGSLSYLRYFTRPEAKQENKKVEM